MLAIPALLLGLLIAAMSITVISNIFSASANKRIQEFGILKCVGATGRQIRASVIYESLWLSLTAIPLGLIAGTILGYISVKFTGHFISDINDAAKEIIMRPFTFSLPFPSIYLCGHICLQVYFRFALYYSLHTDQLKRLVNLLLSSV